MAAGGSTPSLLVNVVGLSRARGQLFNESVGIGKSCFCYRFMHPDFDEYVEDHPSLLALHEFESDVIKSHHNLYWGCNTQSYPIKGKDLNIQFHVVEQTVFYQDITSQPFTIVTKPDGVEAYCRRVCAATDYPGKMSYQTRDGISLHDGYPKQQFPPNASKLPRGFIVVVDVSQEDDSFESQMEKADHLLEYLQKHKRKFIIVATKRDYFNPNSMERLSAIRKKFKTQVVETSANAHLNIANAFRLIAHKVLHKKIQGLSDHVTSYEEAAQMALMEKGAKRNSFRNFLKKRVLNSDDTISEIEYSEPCKDSVKVLGKFETEKIFAEHILETYNSKVSTYPGVHGDPDMRVEFLDDFIEQRSDLKIYMRHLKSWIDRYLQENPEPSPANSPELPARHDEDEQNGHPLNPSPSIAATKEGGLSLLGSQEQRGGGGGRSGGDDGSYQIFEKHDSGCPTESRTSFDPDDAPGSEYSDSFDTCSEHSYQNYDPLKPLYTAPPDVFPAVLDKDPSHVATKTPPEQLATKAHGTTVSVYDDMVSKHSKDDVSNTHRGEPALNSTAFTGGKTELKGNSPPKIDHGAAELDVCVVAVDDENDFCPEYVNFDPSAPAESIAQSSSSDTAGMSVPPSSSPTSSPAPFTSPTDSPSLSQEEQQQASPASTSSSLERQRASPDIRNRARLLEEQLGVKSQEKPPNSPPTVVGDPLVLASTGSRKSSEVSSEGDVRVFSNVISGDDTIVGDAEKFGKQDFEPKQQQQQQQNAVKKNSIQGRAQLLQGLLGGSLSQESGEEDEEEETNGMKKELTLPQQPSETVAAQSPAVAKKRTPSRPAPPIPPTKPKSRRLDATQTDSSNLHTCPPSLSSQDNRPASAPLVATDSEYRVLPAKSIAPATTETIKQLSASVVASLQASGKKIALLPPGVANAPPPPPPPAASDVPFMGSAEQTSDALESSLEERAHTPRLPLLREKLAMKREKQQPEIPASSSEQPLTVPERPISPSVVKGGPPSAVLPKPPPKKPPKLPPSLKAVMLPDNDNDDDGYNAPPPLPPPLVDIEILEISPPRLLSSTERGAAGVSNVSPSKPTSTSSIELDTDEEGEEDDDVESPPPVPMRTIESLTEVRSTASPNPLLPSSPSLSEPSPTAVESSLQQQQLHQLLKAKSSSPTSKAVQQKKSRGILSILTRPLKDRSTSESRSPQRMSESPSRSHNSSTVGRKQRSNTTSTPPVREEEYMAPRFVNMRERPLPAQPYEIDDPDIPQHEPDDYDLIESSNLLRVELASPPSQPLHSTQQRGGGGASVRRVQSFDSRGSAFQGGGGGDADIDFRSRRFPSPPPSERRGLIPPPASMNKVLPNRKSSIDDGYENSDECPFSMKGRPLPSIPLEYLTPQHQKQRQQRQEAAGGHMRSLDYDYPDIRGVRFFQTLPSRGGKRIFPTAASVFSSRQSLPPRGALLAALTDDHASRSPETAAMRRPPPSGGDDYVPMRSAAVMDDNYINWETISSIQAARRASASFAVLGSSVTSQTQTLPPHPPSSSVPTVVARSKRYAMDDMSVYMNLPVPADFPPLPLPTRQQQQQQQPVTVVASSPPMQASPQHVPSQTAPSLSENKPTPVPRRNKQEKNKASSLDYAPEVKPKVGARTRSQTSAAETTSSSSSSSILTAPEEAPEVRPKPRSGARGRSHTSADTITVPAPERVVSPSDTTAGSSVQQLSPQPSPRLASKVPRSPSAATAKHPPKPLPRPSGRSLDGYYVNTRSFEEYCARGDSSWKEETLSASSIDVSSSLPPNFGGRFFDEATGSAGDVVAGFTRQSSGEEQCKIAALPPRNVMRLRKD